MYKKVDTNYDFVAREKEIEKFWKDEKIFEKSMEIRDEDKDSYVFYDGPPTANGKPHIGHVLTRVIKDMIPRFHTMKGAFVPRKAGWDTHGLPVEIEVEKKLGIDGKEQIEDYGLAPFIDHCKESVWKYKGMWEDFSSTVGFWADMDNPYVTYDNNFIESEWWALKKIYEKGLLYKGYKVVPYCPRCGTPLSSHEVAQGYKDVKEKSAIVRFKVKDSDTYILAWTTTPWTLPSNTALCVNQSEQYSKVKAVDGYTYILATNLLDEVLKVLVNDENKEEPLYEVIETYMGSELENIEYVPLFECTQNAITDGKKAHYVVCDDYVTLTDGTGVVHIAPAFGEDDARVGRKYDLPLIQLVNDKGEMTGGTPWDGTFVKDADKLILKDLDSMDKLFSAPEFVHSYPHCWRCDTPLIYYARKSWFIKMTDVKDDLVKNNNMVNWIPESIGKGRFGDWLSNVQDWGISRDRYWGTPLNIWECECGHMHSIGSIEELKELSDDCPDDIELHRPYIDEVTIKCEKCGKKMHRVSEVIDCWFDSGSMPFAQYHYPFENKELFEKRFPADFISEAVDQTRGWFYSLIAISTLIFNKPPYKNVLVLGHVQDKNGQKMSKSKGNAVDPFEALEKYGADAIRWYFYENSQPWLPNKFNDEYVVEGQRKFLGTLWNTYAFFVLYANIDNFNANNYKLEYDKISVMDKWILSRLNTLIKEVDNLLTNYKIPETAKALQSFVDELSNWYVRRSRKRFWAKGMEQDKINAYMTLYTVLVEFAKVSAPMIPFMSEQIYLNLVKSHDESAPISVHLCDYPKVSNEYIDIDLEQVMDTILKIVGSGRTCRNKANIKNRQPINKMYVQADIKLTEFYKDIVLDELNIKSLEESSDLSEMITYKFKPQLKTLGPKYGKQLNDIKQVLESIDSTKAIEELESNNKIILKTSSGVIELEREDLLIEMSSLEGFEASSNGGVIVVIDTVLTDELLDEGFFRELVSKVQTMRKEADFEVMDKITLYYEGSDKIKNIIDKFESEIKKEVLAKEILNTTPDGYVKEWKINTELVKIGIKR